MAEKIAAAKMHGLGNAILIMDMRPCPQTQLAPEFVRALAGKPQTQFDQLMLLYPPQGAAGALACGGADGEAYKVEIRNQDGSEAKACGNGTRCLAEWLYTYSPEAKAAAAPRPCPSVYYFATAGGCVRAERLANAQVRVDMGAPHFAAAAIPLAFTPANMAQVPLADLLPAGVAAAEAAAAEAAAAAKWPASAFILSVGNPHAIFFMADKSEAALAAAPLNIIGPALEHSSAFPEGVNVSLAQVESPHLLRLRVWERGAGLTRACGTAACAAQTAAHKLGLTAAAAEVALPGGRLRVAIEKGRCLMTGPAAYEYSGEINLSSGAFRRAARGRAQKDRNYGD